MSFDFYYILYSYFKLCECAQFFGHMAAWRKFDSNSTIGLELCGNLISDQPKPTTIEMNQATDHCDDDQKSDWLQVAETTTTTIRPDNEEMKEKKTRSTLILIESGRSID